MGMIGFILSPIHPGFMFTGVVVGFLYGMASTWMGVGKLTERFAPLELEDWSLEKFSWQRFWKEWIYFIGVILAVIVAFIIIVIVTGIFRLLNQK